MVYLDYIFSNPWTLLVIAIAFFLLGASVVYMWMWSKRDYIKHLKKQNEDLRYTKNRLLEHLQDYKDMYDSKE